MSRQFCYNSGPITVCNSISFTGDIDPKCFLKLKYKITWTKLFTMIDPEKGGLVKWHVTKLLKIK